MVKIPDFFKTDKKTMNKMKQKWEKEKEINKLPKWEDLPKKKQKEIMEKIKDEILGLRQMLGINRIEADLNKLKELLEYKYKSQHTGYLG